MLTKSSAAESDIVVVAALLPLVDHVQLCGRASILSLPSAAATPAPPQKKAALPSARKPDGISRELFSLIGPSSTTLVAQLAKPRLKQKPNLGAGSKIKWEWRAFKNGARTDSLQLRHWVKASTDPDAEYPFAKYNVQRPTFTYTQEEYTLWLHDNEWTKEETDYLMAIVQEYDTRWYVIQDRYEYSDLKDRYCSVCRKLLRNRPWTGDESTKQVLLSSLHLTKREVLRKRYVTSLENRTPEQIAEEEALYMEIKRLEQNERRFKTRPRRPPPHHRRHRVRAARRRGRRGAAHGPHARLQAQQKKGGGDLDSPSTPLIATPLPKRALPPADAPRTRRTTCSTASHRTDIAGPAGAAASTKAAHQPAYLRSFKMPFSKSAIAPKVTQVLVELGVSPPAADGREGGAGETKKVVDKVEYDIQEARWGEDGGAGRGLGRDGEGGRRAQSVVSTRSARRSEACACHNTCSLLSNSHPEHQARRSLSISSSRHVRTVSTRAGTKTATAS
ncbi:hypothetical protein C8F04DRAFT_1340561 [Mycena alexandri]|uniref:SWR1-complex protein 4 n=1 Tax=Mycena alexandri TaxID=1745969 RepID=A0AAD6WKD2_9AGAR|nr:hypothetical protein C8F04DRAFT_1340561 [Mycena alexandri]